jgi:hypothetical protein
MQPLKLTIPGRYWDSHIYQGRLYLFGMDGDIVTVDWDRLVDSWAVDEYYRLPLECAFLQSNYLYGDEVRSFVNDTDVRELLRKKFAKLAALPLTVQPHLLAEYEIGRQDNPFPFPHSDSEMYRRTLYVSAPSGVVSAGASGHTKKPISTRAERRWDGPVYRLSANWQALALAAGDEGLFELALDAGYGESTHEPKRIAQRRCTGCTWAFHSVFGSTEVGGFLASFIKRESPDGDRHTVRDFDKLMTSEDLWGESGYSWGVQDKLCMAKGSSIRVLKYQPWEKEASNRILQLAPIEVHPWKGQVLSATSASFGVVIETENALVVYPSIGDPVTLPEEPINWRVFNRSKHYENQLHVIWRDRLEILSFNQDYLVDQRNKVLGLSVFATPSRGTRRSVWARHSEW